MEKIPVSLIIDDPSPRVHVYWSHSEGGVTPQGTVLRPDIPNDFLDEFCDIVEKEGLRGKFSIVPMAGCQGDIINGFKDYPDSEIAYWLDTANKRLGGRFSFCPEMLTHHFAYDMDSGKYLDCNEMEWAAKQNRETLGRYITKAVSMLKEAGIRAVGVTSPWAFGIEVEDDYAAAISDAVYNVWGVDTSWYFLRSMEDGKYSKPWVQFREGERRCVSVPATTGDMLWCSIDIPETEVNEALITKLADKILTEDGKSGSFIDSLNCGANPVLLEHWQSLYSNGSRAGLHALAIAAGRINRIYGDRIEWLSMEQHMERTL